MQVALFIKAYFKNPKGKNCSDLMELIMKKQRSTCCFLPGMGFYYTSSSRLVNIVKSISIFEVFQVAICQKKKKKKKTAAANNGTLRSMKINEFTLS